MAIVLEAVESLKQSMTTCLSSERIVSACIAAGHRWRDRKLNPATTIRLFAMQILHGNTACTRVAKWTGHNSVSDTAYCQARARIPLRAFMILFERLAESLGRGQRPTSWRGRRVLLVDGTSCSMPDTPALDDAFGHPSNQKPGCSFPVMKVMALLEATSGLMIGMVKSPLNAHDSRVVEDVHRYLRRDDILIGDRAFASFRHIATLLLRGIDSLFRHHQSRDVDMRRGEVLGVRDRKQIMTRPAKRPDHVPLEVHRGLPLRITVRVIKFFIAARGSRTREIVLVTTLLDPTAYPKEEIIERYLSRWGIEVDFRHIKQTLGMAILKCKTPDGVVKELYMFGIVYNLIRVTMLEAAVRQKVPPDRISFVDAMRWLAGRRTGDPMPRLKVNPRRAGRDRPRVVKRRPKDYPLLQPWHIAQMAGDGGG